MFSQNPFNLMVEFIRDERDFKSKICLLDLVAFFLSVTCKSIYTTCEAPASHGSLILLIHFQPAFLKPLFSPVVPCNCGSCVHVCHSSFTFLLVLEFTPFPFSFSFSHSTHDLTQGENSDRLWQIFRVGHIRT